MEENTYKITEGKLNLIYEFQLEHDVVNIRRQMRFISFAHIKKVFVFSIF